MKWGKIPYFRCAKQELGTYSDTAKNIFFVLFVQQIDRIIAFFAITVLRKLSTGVLWTCFRTSLVFCILPRFMYIFDYYIILSNILSIGCTKLDKKLPKFLSK